MSVRAIDSVVPRVAGLTFQRFADLAEICFDGVDEFFLSSFDTFLEGVPVLFDA